MKNKLNIYLIITGLLLGFIAQSQVRPPALLKAESSSITDPNVKLNWWAPGTPTWLHYDSGVFETGVGTNEEGVYDAAIKFLPADIDAFDAYEVTKIAFVPVESTAKYTLKIWTGDKAENVVYSDTLSGLSYSNWNEITLKTPIVIDGTQTYYFGYNIIATGGFPIGCDMQYNENHGKSDLIRFDTVFYSLFEDFDLVANINLQVYVQPTVKKGKTVALIEPMRKSVAHGKPQKSAKYFDVEFTPAPAAVNQLPDSYNIYRNNEKIASSTVITYDDLLVNSGSYTYEVTALYGAEESAKSNPATVLYDNDRIPVNTVITEVFINTSGPSGSPSSYGAFLGITELVDFEDNVSPVVYHSGTAILGPDEFSTPETEARFMDYVLLTGAFPMALFNGDILLAGGSSTESLYEPYKEKYNLALEQLTPLKFESSIEPISASKYRVNINAEMVGVFPDTGLVLQVVLTQETIDHVWYNSKFSNVRFVATDMVPNESGTPLVFTNKKATASIDVTVDPFKPKSNYRIVVFVQKSYFFSVLNGNLHTLPAKRGVEFTVVDDNNLPIEGATVTAEGESKLTDVNGKATHNIWDNLGEISCTVSKDKYFETTEVFNMDTANSVLIMLVPTSVSNTQSIQAKIYPNPVNNQVFVESQQAVQTSIFDVTGKMIYENQSFETHHTIYIPEFEKGIYFIKLYDGQTYRSIKFVKQ